ncbi:MAG: YihY family inner membrane protein [Candidatus Eisenbacteria bacterium]|nr:YihY family inner membrane protein [Candidatus Eisenbacteria bacterium]
METHIWEQDLSAKPWFEAFLYRQLRVATVLIKGCTVGRVALRASAMTFTTLLTLIPLLILAFTIIRSLGGFTDLEARLETFIIDTFAPGSQEQVRQWMTGFFSNIRSGAYRSVSILILFLGGLGLLGSIEGAFNEIWGVHRGRSLFHRFSTYTTIIFLGPLLIGLSLSMTAGLRAPGGWDDGPGAPLISFLASLGLQLIPILLTGLAFTMLYLIMPNVRVRLRAALPAGLAAGIVWEITKWGYGLYLSQATHYGALYGSLAGIPLFLLWVYLTWLVVLFGAHLTFAQEATDDIRIEEGATAASLRDRFRAGLHVMLAASAAHRSGQSPPDLASLARWLGLPSRLVRSAAEALIEGGMLHQVASDPRDWALVPARDPQRITLLGIWRCMTEVTAGEDSARIVPPPSTPPAAGDPAWVQVEETMNRLDQSLAEEWGRTDLGQMLGRLPEDPTGAPAHSQVVSFPAHQARSRGRRRR